jgi:Tfp pilus assembly protein PilV
MSMVILSLLLLGLNAMQLITSKQAMKNYTTALQITQDNNYYNADRNDVRDSD